MLGVSTGEPPSIDSPPGLGGSSDGYEGSREGSVGMATPGKRIPGRTKFHDLLNLQKKEFLKTNFLHDF